MDQQSDAHIGVTLSGGGHRAALFTLGAMLYLVDAGKARETETVSSVSGGSLTNGYLAAQIDLRTASSRQMRSVAGRLARQICSPGTLFAAPLTWIYCSAVIALAVVMMAAPVIGLVGAVHGALHLPWWGLACWVAGLLVLGLLLSVRSAVAARAFDGALFDGATLAGITHTSVAHVLCATDIQTSEAVFFSQRFLYAYRWGWGIPGRLSVARAVQASAAFPGGFNVVRMNIGEHRFGRTVRADRTFKRSLSQRLMAALLQSAARHRSECADPPEGEVISRFKLLDGGAYDNMGTEWLIGLRARLEDTDNPPPRELSDIDEVVVVNASAGRGVVARPAASVPLFGEVASLLAVKDVLYDESTAVRRRLLNLRYAIARDTAEHQVCSGARIRRDALRGTTVQISSSPFDITAQFAGGDPIGQRAAAAIRYLTEASVGSDRGVASGEDDARAYWRRLADVNSAVGTTLWGPGVERAAALLFHGYVLTMVNCHVLLGYRLARSGLTIDDFRCLVTGGADGFSAGVLFSD